jgi:hypothetical protein
MGEVAQHRDVLGLDRLDQFGETTERLLADAGRRGRAQRAEGRSLAEMEIGDEEGLRCQEPSWNENTKVFSGLAINSENIGDRYSHY